MRIQKIKHISLSNDTIKSRIADMACDIKFQLIENIKASPVFGIQLDELVDSANTSELMVFVRYIYNQTIDKTSFFATHRKQRRRPAMCYNL